ncbi:hypothetical protein, conserved [Trypanosoma brucei gambiense DAL972]|uniref:Uncharacterized protein n=2 Tax=Trypanosoma brucei TaxID=5691 RepID=D0A8F8_TRYB9|nr:hypothetical protein, conserved [Trypanosoma brucei gambiense DAL972]RHW67419.1 hypothetical protein DPX39_110067200 [Trypanosoma brucei equiperdum]CBH17959.1 hypothetical protein, conserved [Trypanosoma brucei gambiense DAL972]|eukprot:XP_011780223.1 hypothetical protein, conserved [Trypanosoma brucei gambiense DAL972]
MWRRGVAAVPLPLWQGKLLQLVHHRALSTDTTGDEATAWSHAMEAKYGTGTYKLFRPLYKDLSDEMRLEAYTKPPAPMQGWSVHHDEAVNLAIFSHKGDSRSRTARVVAYSPITVENPESLNPLLYFMDWYPINVLMERNGVIVHFSIASTEGGMHMRNVRVYKAQDELSPNDPEKQDLPNRDSECERLMSTTDDAAWVRHNLYYDGPCLWHLELDMLNELYDVMQDHGVTLDWVRWVAEWVHYLEHVSYVRWTLGVLQELIPVDERGPEDDFLTSEEKEALATPPEEWLEAHYI